MEEDLHYVGPGRNDWRHEVIGMRWIKKGVAATVVHQGCPVPIRDLDIMARTGGDITASLNFKIGELQPQYLPRHHLYCLCHLMVDGVFVGIVW